MKAQTHREKPPFREAHRQRRRKLRPMALSDAAREWFTKNGLEGFLRIADAPPHEEPKHVASTIDLAEITEGTIQALTGLQARGLQSVENPSSDILLEYFGEYSLSSKAYRT